MFAVEYSNDHPWKRYDTYATRAEADKVARFLKSHGNAVRVVPINPAAAS